MCVVILFSFFFFFTLISLFEIEQHRNFRLCDKFNIFFNSSLTDKAMSKIIFPENINRTIDII